MKNTIKPIALALSAALTFSVFSVVNCSAETYQDNDYIYIKPPKETVTVDFVILGYKEKKGELTITGCYDYDPYFPGVPYYGYGGYIPVMIMDGVLEIPSHIDDKPVVDIKNLSGNDKFTKIVVPDAITKILKSAFRGKNYEVGTADGELRLVTVYTK